MSVVPLSAGKDRVVFKPAHQTCYDAGKLPHYVYVTRSTALPSAWAGSETFCEFELPQTLGTVEEIIVRFQITASASTVAPPTTFWVSRTEEYIGADLLATTYANDQHNETVGFLNPQRLDQLNEALNMNIDYTNGTIPSGTSYYYLPLSATSFNTMNPYVKGFQAKLKVRLYFPASLVISGGTLTLSDVLLIAKERVSKEDEQLSRAHSRGTVDYNAIVRERQVENTTLTSGADTTIFLRSFKNDSAGLLVYLTDQSPAMSNLTVRLPIQTLQLQDQVGNKISEVLRQDFVRPFVWSDHIDSAYVASGSNNNVNLIPFSSKFQATASTGCDYGAYPMTSLEKLVIRPSDASANYYGSKAINVTSYSYAHVVVNQGRHFITMSSTSGGR
jgi:hypothetical protein